MPREPARKITLRYRPRYPWLHKELESHRYCVIIAHRRAGKTVSLLNHLIKSALLCETPFGLFAYVAPLKTQARSVAWDYLKFYTADIPGRVVSESHLSIKVPSRNGMAQCRLFGADNIDALRGLGLDMAILDEMAQMREGLLRDVIRPALADKHGQLVICGTPAGPNQLRDEYMNAKKEMDAGNPDYYALKLSVHETTALSDEEIEQLRNTMGKDAFAREMECSFDVSAEEQLISLQSIYAAQGRRLNKQDYEGSPLIVSADVARRGSDNTVICIRQGVYVEPLIVLTSESTMDIVSYLTKLWHERKPDGILVETTGVGGPIVDRLVQLQVPVIGVEPGGRAMDSDRFYNKRAEMWIRCRDWIEKDGALPPDEDLALELATPMFEYTLTGQLQVESKKAIRKRIKRSTDRADALCIGFSEIILSRKELELMAGSYKTIAEGVEDYEPLAY